MNFVCSEATLRLNSPTTLIDVALGDRAYKISIGTDNLTDVGKLVTGVAKIPRHDAPHAVIITDENVHDSHATAVAESLTDCDWRVDILLLEPGEQTKSVEAVDGLWRAMLEIGTDRKSFVVAVGGGVIGDLAGFAAATYARGLSFVQIPTTLLAQVDSSVGGKVGVNLPAAKNMVGAFWQPRAVLIDTHVLTTLPDRQYAAGLAEIVKYGVILDSALFEYLEANRRALISRDDEALRHVIARGCQLKADVVADDERDESGLRALLNYGHTFGHAVETLTGYGEFLHGEAVSIGMLCASRLAEKLGRVTPEVTRRQAELLRDLGLPVDMPPLDAEKMMAAMTRDKKTEQGRLHFVLPSRIGHVELVSVADEDTVRDVL